MPGAGGMGAQATSCKLRVPVYLAEHDNSCCLQLIPAASAMRPVQQASRHSSLVRAWCKTSLLLLAHCRWGSSRKSGRGGAAGSASVGGGSMAGDDFSSMPPTPGSTATATTARGTPLPAGDVLALMEGWGTR